LGDLGFVLAVAKPQRLPVDRNWRATNDRKIRIARKKRRIK